MRPGVVIGVAAVLVVTYAAADAADSLPDAVPGLLTFDEPWEEPAPFPVVALDPPPTAPAPSALDRTPSPAEQSRIDALTRALVADARLGAGAGAVVVDVASGEVLAQAGAEAPRIPASTVKVLTTTAALTALGEETRIPTRVVAGPDLAAAEAGTGTVYLVGGGDVLLAPGAGDEGAVVGRAGLGDLAARTAAALAERGVASVRILLDDSAFEGPTTAPGWGPIDLGGGFVAPVAALAVDRGIVPGQTVRDADAALSAARTFASALAAEGIAVEPDVTRGAAPDGGRELARVESATVGDLVEHTLVESDNDVAEALARLTAIAAGEPGSFEGASRAIPAAVAEAGLAVDGVRIADGSGLSEGNRVPPLVLARLVALIADPAHPDLLRVATGLPAAGLDGTLAGRFDGPGDAATGVLRAKTGTLLTVVGLAGLVPGADGNLLAFAVLADGVPVGGVALARDAMDEWASALTQEAAPSSAP